MASSWSHIIQLSFPTPTSVHIVPFAQLFHVVEDSLNQAPTSTKKHRFQEKARV